jgi:protein-disulfide isomerase
MKIHHYLVPALAALALAGCNKQADNGSAPAAGNAATPAAAVAPPAGGWVEQVTKTPDGGYLMGNPNAPVKLIEYGSRTCPHCAHFTETGVPSLKSKYIATGKVSYEFRDFLIHPMDLAAILVGQCNGPSTFFPILEQMMSNQQPVFDKLQKLPQGFENSLAGKTPSEQAAIWADALGYVQFVGQRGVPEAKARQCLADPKGADAVTKVMNGASQFNIDSTPTFIINGNKTDALDWATLEPLLKAAGA